MVVAATILLLACAMDPIDDAIDDAADAGSADAAAWCARTIDGVTGGDPACVYLCDGPGTWSDGSCCCAELPPCARTIGGVTGGDSACEHFCDGPGTWIDGGDCCCE